MDGCAAPLMREVVPIALGGAGVSAWGVIGTVLSGGWVPV